MLNIRENVEVAGFSVISVQSCSLGGLQTAGTDWQPESYRDTQSGTASLLLAYFPLPILPLPPPSLKYIQVLADLVQGEFMQLQTKQDEEDR